MPPAPVASIPHPLRPKAHSASGRPGIRNKSDVRLDNGDGNGANTPYPAGFPLSNSTTGVLLSSLSIKPVLPMWVGLEAGS